MSRNPYPPSRYPTPPVRPLGTGNNPNRQTPARPAVAVTKANASVANLPLIGPSPGAPPVVWTERLQLLDYLPVLRDVNPAVQYRTDDDGQPTVPFWEKGFPKGLKNPQTGKDLNGSQSWRGNETWMAQERGFIAPTPCSHCVSATGLRSFTAPCVLIYAPGTSLNDACANCFYRDGAAKCSLREAYRAKLLFDQETDDCEHEYLQYRAQVEVYNAQQLADGLPPMPFTPKLPDLHSAGRLGTPARKVHPGIRTPTGNQFGRTCAGPPDNPSTDMMYIARLIRLMDPGDGSLILPGTLLNIDDPAFDVSYGDYLLYVEHPPKPGRSTLMRNYAGQQALVPTMMLQEIPAPWGLTGNILDPDGKRLDMRFLQNMVSVAGPGVISPLRQWDWKDMECVLFVADDAAWLEDGVVDAEGNCATFNRDVTDAWAFGSGPDEPTNAEIGLPFERPWNILVNLEAVAQRIDVLHKAQNIEPLN